MNARQTAGRFTIMLSPGPADAGDRRLPETNPNRLYAWESTANGYNQFEEQYRVARRASSSDMGNVTTPNRRSPFRAGAR